VDAVLQIIIALAFIIYSVWSEMKKGKGSETTDFDLNDLGSIDDFFKKQPKSEQKSASIPSKTEDMWSKPAEGGFSSEGNEDPFAEKAASKSSSSSKKKGRSKKHKLATIADARQPTGGESWHSDESGYTHDHLPSLKGQVNYDQAEGPPKINYDTLDGLTGRGGPTADPRADSALSPLCSGRLDELDWSSPAATHFHVNLDRDHIISALLLGEVLPRRDLNRIFDRIPQVRRRE
jgi:hypothetical protein